MEVTSKLLKSIWQDQWLLKTSLDSELLFISTPLKESAYFSRSYFSRSDDDSSNDFISQSFEITLRGDLGRTSYTCESNLWNVGRSNKGLSKLEVCIIAVYETCEWLILDPTRTEEDFNGIAEAEVVMVDVDVEQAPHNIVTTQEYHHEYWLSFFRITKPGLTREQLSVTFSNFFSPFFYSFLFFVLLILRCWNLI